MTGLKDTLARLRIKAEASKNKDTALYKAIAKLLKLPLKLKNKPPP